MKKFFAVMLLAVGIVFGNFQTTQAMTEYQADEYAYSENGIDYRVITVMHEGARFGALVIGVKDRNIVDALAFVFIYDSEKRNFYYDITRKDKTKNGTVIEKGYLVKSKSHKSGAVFFVIMDVFERNK